MPRKYVPRQTQRAIAMRQARAAKNGIPVEPPIDEPGPITEDIPAIEVVEPASKPKSSLKERLMGKVAQPSPNKQKRTKKIDNNLLQQLAPTLISTFVATYSKQLIADPYKPCAPAQEEVLAMVAPYFNILSRYIEITGQASQNTLDLINAVLASIMYGVRAYVTYVQIKEAEKNHESLEQFNARKYAEYVASISKEQEAIDAANNDTAEDYRSTGHLANESSNAKNGDSHDQNGNSSDRGSEADRVANLLQRDVEGRRKLGLV